VVSRHTLFDCIHDYDRMRCVTGDRVTIHQPGLGIQENNQLTVCRVAFVDGAIAGQ
jgi:hypothetical protein